MRDRISHQWQVYPQQWGIARRAARRALIALAAVPALYLSVMDARAQDKDPLLSIQPEFSGQTEQTLSISQEQALWTALAFEDADTVRRLLELGADPNKTDEISHMTPLMACETSAVAQALLDAGADPLARDRIGRTALHHAVLMREARNIIPLLVKKGVDVNIRSANGDTPLMVVVGNYTGNKNGEPGDAGALETVLHVLQALHADFNAPDNFDRTPLAVAASRNQPQLIRILIKLGADPAKRLGNGRTPLDYAREANAQDAIQVLAALTETGRAQ